MSDRPIGRERFFVLQRRPFKERDDIIVCLGWQSGRFSAIVKGSRSAKSRLSGLLEPPVELEGSLREGSGLDSLTQPQLLRAFVGLRKRLDALLAAGFLARLFLEALPEKSPVEELYLLLGSLLDKLSEGAPVTSAALIAQDRLLQELGVELVIDGCVVCGSEDVRGYSDVDGGLLCPYCYKGRGFSVAWPVVMALREVREAEIEGVWPDLSSPIVREIGRIYKGQFQQHLGLADRLFRAVLPSRVRQE